MLLLFLDGDQSSRAKTTDAIIAQQAKQIADLIDRVSELELQLAKALKNSSNSSKSP